MPPPFLAALSPDEYGFVRCASGCDSWAPHHVCLDGAPYRLCSSCVLLSHPDAFCSACLLLLSPSAYATAAAACREAHVYFSPGPTAACTNCGVSVAHLSCVADPYSFVCPPCAAAVDNTPFSYDTLGSGRRTLDGRGARVLLTAALLAHEAAVDNAAAARETAERVVEEATAARSLARAMLDAAFRAAGPSAFRDATPSAPTVDQLNKKTPNSNGHKTKTPKSNDASRERDKRLNFDDVQQPALAFATAAAFAAAASSTPSPMPSSRLDQSQVKQAAIPLLMPSPRLDSGGSADRVAKDDYRALFGTLQ